MTGKAKKPKDLRAPWPGDLLRDKSESAGHRFLEAAVWGLVEDMHECDSDSADQRRVLAGATAGQLKLAAALFCLRYFHVKWDDFGDFLGSESGWSAALVADGLKAIGAATAAGLIRKLLVGLPDPLTIDAEERAVLWAEGETPSREALTSRLAKEMERLDIDHLEIAAGAYTRKHPDEFFVRPKTTKA